MAQCEHHEPTATLDLTWVYCQPGRRPRLERGGCRFESCHPDQPITIPTQSVLTLRHGANTHSVGYRAVTPRSASSVLVRIQVAPPSIGPLAQLADAAPSKGDRSGFESRAAYQVDCLAGGIGIRAGLRNRILRVRVLPKDSWQNGIAPVLKTVSLREPGGVGSTPTLSAKGRLPERQWVGLLSRSRSAMAAKVRTLHLPPCV